MKEYLVVDGYNIIFSWPDFEKMKKNNLDHARARLLDILVNYAAISGESVLVVFDAHLVRNNTEHSEVAGKNVEVIFTQEGETADSVIERLVGDLSGRGNNVYVATSDGAEQSLIFGLGAYRLTPRELLDRVKRARKESERHYRSTPPGEAYLENRLVDEVRKALEDWRRKKS
ncbi:MAG: NYN domain-containing protein [Actinobacteria bacterium]|nr:NYN domain-containing protein [Actinomycetota bacterium]